MITADMKQILKELEEQEQFPKINVELLDNELPSVYSVSKKGEADFLDYPPLLRQAISLSLVLAESPSFNCDSLFAFLTRSTLLSDL